MSLLLLPVEPADAPSLADLRVEAMRESLEAVGRFDPQRARARLLDGFDPQATRHIHWNGEHAGFVAVQRTRDGLLLSHLYLRPPMQGRGLGAQVLQAVFREADEAALPLAVGALRGSRANAFYLRHGFVKTGESDWDVHYLRLPASADTGAQLRGLYEGEGGVGNIFSSRVRDYVASRPDYPAALFDNLAAAGAMRTGTVVADVGAGTGLLTRSLLERGCEVVAVEPNDEMRAAADALLGAHAGYRSAPGSAEALPLPDHSADLVTAAQAFHWFEPEAARRECLRVLRPGGQVLLVWNDRVLQHPLHVALDELFAAVGGSKRAALAAHEERLQVPVFFGGAKTVSWKLPHQQVLDEQGLLSLVFSRSYMPPRGSAGAVEAEQWTRRVFAAFADHGRLVMPYETIAILGRPA